MTEEVKSCPFCGGKEVKLFKDGSIWVVECMQCLAKVGATAEADVLDFWNSRPIEDALQKELDEAREDNADNMEYHVAERGRLKTENARLRGKIEAIKKIVEKPPMSIYDAARIYAECCDALGEEE